MKKWSLFIFLLLLTGCAATGYNSHYIVSDTSDEIKANYEEEASE